MKTREERIYQEKGDTWPKALKYNYDKYGDTRCAMRHKHYGIWHPYTWKDYYLNVKYLALGLISLGFEPGHKVLIIGDNAPEWYYAELAAQANHGVAVGLYSELPPAEIKYIAENAEAEFAIVEDQEQVDKFLELKDELPLLKKVIYWNYKGLAHYDDPLLLGYKQVIKLGEEYEETHFNLFEQNIDAGKANDVCAIVYTPGTSGTAPKGAVHTYKTMRAGADYHLQLDSWHERDNVIPYLPPVWITEQWLCIGCHLLSACMLNFAEAPETQLRDTRETNPSIVFYNARLWESQAAMIQALILEASAFKQLLFRRFMPIGLKMADRKHSGQRPSLGHKALYALANIVLFKPIKADMGLSNAEICYSTGAILSPDALRFYHALNIPVKSLYGSTEGGNLTGANNDNILIGTVGPAHKGTKAKVTDQGELIYQQPGIFVGYYKDPTKTAAVLKDGWFYSGDSGFIREDGHIEIFDRLADLIVLANGHKLSPQLIESRLRFSPFIKDAWVFADSGKNYASAIIVINYNQVSKWAGQRRVTYNDFAELSQSLEVYDLIKEEINRINNDLPHEIQLKKYINLHKEFEAEKGEVTRTRMLRRPLLRKYYSDIIDAVYTDQPDISIETKVQSRDGSAGTKMTTLLIQSI